MGRRRRVSSFLIILALLTISTATAANGPRGSSPPVVVKPPSVLGAAVEGQTVVADAGRWSGPTKSYSFRWLRCDSEGAACAPTGVSQVRYVVISADVGSTLRVTVIATNKRGSTAATSAPTPVVASRASASGSSSSSTTTAASPIAPTNTSLPTISGATQLGQPLAASTGTWSGTQPI